MESIESSCALCFQNRDLHRACGIRVVAILTFITALPERDFIRRFRFAHRFPISRAFG
jgi:hypothetical protein